MILYGYCALPHDAPAVVLQDIDVPKIIKGKPLDSLEFMQWFKGYWDKVCTTSRPPTCPLPQFDFGGCKRQACATPALSTIRFCLLARSTAHSVPAENTLGRITSFHVTP